MNTDQADNSDSVQPLFILGAGRFAQEVADLVGDVPGFRVRAFVQNLDHSPEARRMRGLPVLRLEDASAHASSHWVLGAIGSPRRRELIEQAEAVGFSAAVVTHPAAHLSSTTDIRPGSLVSVAVVCGAYSQIGRHAILNRGALIGHHVRIGDYATIGPGANIGGSCSVGDEVQIGMNAAVLDHLNVGEGAVVGAGALVTKDVPPYTQVLGVPARVTKDLRAAR